MGLGPGVALAGDWGITVAVDDGAGLDTADEEAPGFFLGPAPSWTTGAAWGTVGATVVVAGMASACVAALVHEPLAGATSRHTPAAVVGTVTVARPLLAVR
jgi:hypothetical protein